MRWLLVAANKEREKRMQSRASMRRTWAGMTVLCVPALALLAAPGAHATTPKLVEYQDSDRPAQQ